MKLLLGNIVLKFLDVYLTYIIISIGGVELNPLVRLFIKHTSLEVGLTTIFFLATLLLIFIYKSASNYVKYLLPLFILHSCIVGWNIYLLSYFVYGIM